MRFSFFRVDMGDFFQFFVIWRSTEILIETNFRLGMNVPYILNWLYVGSVGTRLIHQRVSDENEENRQARQKETERERERERERTTVWFYMYSDCLMNQWGKVYSKQTGRGSLTPDSKPWPSSVALLLLLLYYYFYSLPLSPSPRHLPTHR